MYVKILTERSVNQLKKNYNKKYIYLTDYETIISNTKKELIKISKFLNTSLSKKLLNLLRKKKCPKIINYKLRKKKLDYINKGVSNKYQKMLIEMEKNYSNDIYGLKKLNLNDCSFTNRN